MDDQNNNQLAVRNTWDDVIHPFSVAPPSDQEGRELYLEQKSISYEHKLVAQNRCLDFLVEHKKKSSENYLAHEQKMLELQYETAKARNQKMLELQYETAKANNQNLLKRNLTIYNSDEYKEKILSQVPKDLNFKTPETSQPNTSAHFERGESLDESQRPNKRPKINNNSQESDNIVHLLTCTNLPKHLKEKLLDVSEVSKKRCRRKECLEHVKTDHQHFMVDLNKCESSLRDFIEGNYQGLSGILSMTRFKNKKDYLTAKKNFF